MIKEVLPIKILITGASGQIGRECVQVLKKGHEVFGYDKTELDITNTHQVSQIIESIEPDLIINCAGYTDLDECEKHPYYALQINLSGLQNLVVECVKRDIVIVQFSTDQVFDGEKTRFYKENDLPNPINIYGKTKYFGEQLIKNFCKKYFIIRTSRVFSIYDDNFFSIVFEKIQKKQPVTIIDDQIGSPTYVKDLIHGLKLLLSTKHYGIYHITNRGYCSWLDFGNQIVKNLELSIQLETISSDKAKQLARRPQKVILSNEKIGRLVKWRIPTWEDALERCMKFRQNR